MSQTKVKSGLLNFPDQTDFVKLPSGTTAQRPVSPEEGYTRFNTTTDKLEFFDGVRWVATGEKPPTLTSVDYPGNALAADIAGGETILINGTNFASGISVTIGVTDVSVVTLNSPTQLAITSPALTAGDYDVTVTNLDGSTITALDFISYNGVPSWVTASGSLGSLNFGEAISTITLSATEPDSGIVTYAVTSGALPVGLTLSSSGEITGTMPSGSSETTYSFTVTATDDENQSTDRAFTITGVVPFVPSEHFNTVLHTPNNTGNSISLTGVGFQPDFVWMKYRYSTPATGQHYLFNSVTGDSILKSNSTQSEISSGYIESFDPDGVTYLDTLINRTGADSVVAWCWKAGGASVSNTDGTITSQVSANPAAGFSIVEWDTTSAAAWNVGHGLGTAPSIIISKMYTFGNAWEVYHKDLGTGKFLQLSTSSAVGTDAGAFSSVTDTTWTSYTTNTLGSYIAYCFSEVEGFSKFGSYVGTGNTVNVVTGFEPAMIIIKRTDSIEDWKIIDNKRGFANSLEPNESIAEEVGNNSNFILSNNGFTIGDTSGDYNANGGSYIYMAFAADPNTQVPTKADSFNTVTYTGNGGSQSITGVGFKPDLTWVKSRSINYDHQLHDSVRGPGYGLLSNLTAAENFYNTITSFDSDGFTVNASSFIGTNANGQTFVAWNWKGAEIPAINSNGSITSVVSANPAAGFSIVSYTGNGSNATIGHGLNNAPDVLIVKRRNASGSWNVYHSALGNNSTLILQLTTAELIGEGTWGTTTPTSSVFTAGTGINDTNNYIAYCFAEVAGFSKFGSYVGTGASQTIVTGFEPAFVMIKRATGGSLNGWVLSDNKRGAGINLFANTIGTEGDESAYGPTSFTSNGFTLAQAGGNTNISGSTYIYMAFANQF